MNCNALTQNCKATTSYVAVEESRYAFSELRDSKNLADFQKLAESSKVVRIGKPSHALTDDWKVVTDASKPLSKGVRYREAKKSAKAFSTVLELFLSTKHTSEPIELVEAENAAIAIAACYDHSFDMLTAPKIVNWLKENDVNGVRVATVRKKIESKRCDREREPASSVKVCEVYPEVTGSSELVIPPTWQASGDSIECLEFDIEPLPSPIFISSRAKQQWDGKEAVTLKFRRDRKWRSLEVPRGTIAVSRKIVELADDGLLVTSFNADSFVRYLTDFEVANGSLIPMIELTNHFGWQDRKCSRFLCGKKFINQKGNIVDGASSGKGQLLKFVGADAGDNEAATAIRKNGTFEGWLDTMKMIDPSDHAKIGVIASLAAPLLEIVDADGFIVEFCGITSGGKTTTLQLGASVWGDYKGLLDNWYGTDCSFERSMALAHSMPVFRDEVGVASKTMNFSQQAYSVANGRGKGRGSKAGLQSAGRWKTILISSGEHGVADLTPEGGAKARIVPIEGSPLGEHCKENAKRANRLKKRSLEHFGHAGPKFVSYLLKHRADWKKWRARFKELTTKYSNKSVRGGVASRIAGYLAVLSLTLEIARTALKLPWNSNDPIELVFDEVMRSANEADRALVALHHVVDFAAANRDRFAGIRDKDVPRCGWAGLWLSPDRNIPIDSDDDDENSSNSGESAPTSFGTLAFVRRELEQVLKEGGFNPATIIKEWKRRGWIEVDSEGNPRKGMRSTAFPGGSAWFVCFTSTALEQLDRQ